MAVQNNLSPVAGTSPTGKEARHSTRFRVLLNAELVSLTDEQPVRVRDISTGGAMIEGQRPIAGAEEAVLRRGSIEIFGRISWTSGNQGGIEFDEVLSEAEMMAFVHEPAKRASFVPEPFRSDAADEQALPGDWHAVDAFRSPIGSGIFGR